MKRFSGVAHLVALCLLALSRVDAQTDTLDVPSDIPPSIGNLKEAIKTLVASGALSETVLRLEPHGYYELTGTITVPPGEYLTIIAERPGSTQDSAPPRLVWSDTVDFMQLTHYFRCFGNITLRNLWLLYERTDGQKLFVSLQIEDSPDTVSGQVAEFDGVIFDRSGIPANASGAVGITARHFKGMFKNCYFKNCVDELWRYYGRALSFPFGSEGWHSDSVTFENCTFANIGYVYQQESGNYADFVKFNHCTFLNVVGFPLESGWWKQLAVTNCVFVNTHMYGHIPADMGEADSYGGTIWIDSVSQFGHAVPFIDRDRQILFASNSYFIEPWLQRWMHENPASEHYATVGEFGRIPVPQPMLNARTIHFFEGTDIHGQKVFPLMNKRDTYDSTDPGFKGPPSDTAKIKTFLYYRWNSAETLEWSFAPEQSLQGVWPLTEDLAYVNPTLITAGMNAFPLGDLYHWWPDEYAQWESQKEGENARIAQWMATGIDPGVVAVEVLPRDQPPLRFALEQNYPNPFNPNSDIRYLISEFSDVRIVVYDLLGREVAVLVNEWKEPGSYIVRFNAAGLASGVYLCRLTAGTFVQSRKLVLAK